MPTINEQYRDAIRMHALAITDAMNNEMKTRVRVNELEKQVKELKAKLGMDQEKEDKE